MRRFVNKGGRRPRQRCSASSDRRADRPAVVRARAAASETEHMRRQLQRSVVRRHPSAELGSGGGRSSPGRRLAGRRSPSRRRSGAGVEGRSVRGVRAHGSLLVHRQPRTSLALRCAAAAIALPGAVLLASTLAAARISVPRRPSHRCTPPPLRSGCCPLASASSTVSVGAGLPRTATPAADAARGQEPPLSRRARLAPSAPAARDDRSALSADGHPGAQDPIRPTISPVIQLSSRSAGDPCGSLLGR